jgi:O-methyltransferase
MDNVFITQYFDWNRPPSRNVRWANAILSRLGFKARLIPPHATGEQTSIEQRINLYHLAGEVMQCHVPGEFIEIGSHQGSTAALLQIVMKHHGEVRRLQIYDAFFDSSPEVLLANFHALQLGPPIIHAGLVRDVLPAALPDQIAFAHIDIGWRQPADEQYETIAKCLNDVYPRLAPGAIVVVADYCQPDVFRHQGFTPPPEVANSQHWNQYPAINHACDAFLSNKPESMALLYGGPYSHGFFRRQTEALETGGR